MVWYLQEQVHLQLTLDSVARGQVAMVEGVERVEVVEVVEEVDGVEEVEGVKEVEGLEEVAVVMVEGMKVWRG